MAEDGRGYKSLRAYVRNGAMDSHLAPSLMYVRSRFEFPQFATNCRANCQAVLQRTYRRTAGVHKSLRAYT